MHVQSLAYLTHVKLNRKKAYVSFEGQQHAPSNQTSKQDPEERNHEETERQKDRNLQDTYQASTKRPRSRSASSKRGVLFCPKCGSTNLFWASGLPHLWSIWECRNCGYRGAFIVRDGEMAEKVRRKLREKNSQALRNVSAKQCFSQHLRLLYRSVSPLQICLGPSQSMHKFHDKAVEEHHAVDLEDAA